MIEDDMSYGKQAIPKSDVETKSVQSSSERPLDLESILQREDLKMLTNIFNID